MHKLYRSRSDRMIGGICGGLGSYFQLDSTVIRLVLVFLWIFTAVFPLLIAYLIALFIIPVEPPGVHPLPPRRLYRSRTNRMLGGICGGFAEWRNIDPSVVRLILVFLCFITGIAPLLIAYLIGWIIIPQKKPSAQ